MSDMLEIDTGDEMATRIAAVGEAVARAAEDLKFAAERLLAQEELVKQAEMTARTAEEQIRQAERRAERAEGAASRMTSSLADAERRAKEATDQFEELEERTSQAELLRARAAEEQAAQTAAKSSELLEDLQKTRGQLAEAEGRFRRADERAHAGEEKARLLEEQAQELKARLAEIKKLHLGGVPLVADKERSTLKDAVAGEVRRPLTSILGIALAMKHTDPKASDSQEMIRQLSSNARKLDRLVSVLLRMSTLAVAHGRPAERARTGISLLSRLADVHDGRAWVEEREGGGASFRVFLPDVMEGGNPVHAPGADRTHDGAADEHVTI
jgi:K+-sensing histidine kinase KdpD